MDTQVRFAYWLEDEEDRELSEAALAMMEDAPATLFPYKNDAILRLRHCLACHAIGEPPLRSREELFLRIDSWVEQRMIEISEGVAAHNSEVNIVSYNQELWGIRDRQALQDHICRMLGVAQKV